MNEIKKYLTPQEEIEKQKEELAELERIYNDRIKLGVEHIESETFQGLAQTILNKKKQIEDLQAQIDIAESSEQNNEENKHETSIVKYYKNPILNWLQKMVIKIEAKIARIDEKEAERRNRKNAGPKFYQTKTEEYQEVIDTESSNDSQQRGMQSQTWKLSQEQQNEYREEQAQIAKKYREEIKNMADSKIRDSMPKPFKEIDSK